MKKIISIVLLLAMCLSLFAACTEEKKVDTAGLDKAKEFIRSSYLNDEATTAIDYKLGGIVIIDIDGTKTEYKVDWSASSDKVTFVRGEDNYVTVKVPVDNLEDLKYTLIATVSDGNGNSRTVEFERLVPARPGIPTNVADGTYVIVYENNTMAALAADKTYGYAPFNEITITDGAASGFSAEDVVTIKNVDGGFTMQDSYGRYYYLKGTYNSFNIGTEIPDDANGIWQLLTGKDGKQFILNAGNMKTLAFDTTYSSWGVYPEIKDGRQPSISVIAVTAPEGGDEKPEDKPSETPEEKPEDKPVEKPEEKPEDKPVVNPTGGIADGKYVICAPAYNKALSSEKALNKDGLVGFYNAGVDVTVSGSTVSGYGDSEVWTVTNNADGSITISQNGQNLGLGEQYSSMNLGEVNDKWVLEDAGNGLYYIKNVVRGNYIEWYDQMNNWSSYGKIGSGSEGLFALAFFAV